MKKIASKVSLSAILMVFVALLLPDAIAQPVSAWDQVPATVKKKKIV